MGVISISTEKAVMNEESFKIYKRLIKDIKKNKKKLLKLCKKYIETNDESLIIDIAYYSDELADDLQSKSLLFLAYGIEED